MVFGCITSRIRHRRVSKKKMENLLGSFKQARHFCDETWAPERRKLLEDLKSIKDEVQRQGIIHSIGSITYSSAGIVGGGLAIAGIITAPFTFGASLGLTVAGIATGLTSGVAGYTHTKVKSKIVEKQYTDANTCLIKHYESCKEMIGLLELLELDMKTMKFRRDHMESNFKELLTDVEGVDIAGWVDDIETLLTIGKLHTANSSVHVAIKIVTNLASLIWNAVELSGYNKGQLCYDAQRLQSVIEKMQQELDNFINTMLLIEQRLQNGFMKKKNKLRRIYYILNVIKGKAKQVIKQ